MQCHNVYFPVSLPWRLCSFQLTACGASGHRGRRATLTASTTDAVPAMPRSPRMVAPTASATTLTPRTAPMACAEVRYNRNCCEMMVQLRF